jgi:hypothetical protein
LVFALLPCAVAADPGSLYGGAAPRPGPDILYAPVVTAPPLTNDPAGIWDAPPILVSGATAYRQGEFLYQDWIYDDRGGAGGGANRDQGDVRNGAAAQSGGNGGEVIINPSFGTYTYPQARDVFAENAADLLELRVKPQTTSTAFRVTLNTLTAGAVQQEAVAFTIALGRCPAGVCGATTNPFPHNAHATAAATVFITVHGTGGDVEVVGSGNTPLPPGAVNVDLARHQFQVDLPHSTWDPGSDVIRTTAGVGTWDEGASQYMVPQANADNTHPGGLGDLSSATASAFFNIAFRDTRRDNPNSETYHPLATWADPVHGSLAEPTFWRDYAQGLALRNGDLTPFHADIDFAKMLSPDPLVREDDSAVPATGAMDRLFSSHWDLGPGVDFNQGCSATSPSPCPPEYLGQVQPYAIYVPTTMPAAGYGMTLLPHSLSGSYNQYYGTNNQSGFGERDGQHTSIVITTEDRGPDNWYHNLGGADPFEAWADVASRFRLDPAFSAIGGYSMGGYATYKFATQYPDLFAIAQPTVGPPAVGIWVPPNAPTGGDFSNTNRMLASLRNIPFLLWNSVNDELVPYPGAQVQANNDPAGLDAVLAQTTSFDKLGYRYQFWLFNMPPGTGHLGLALHDNFGPASEFLGAATVDRDPAHVTYVRNPAMDYADFGTTADHAYWLSGVALRDGGGDAPIGTIDVLSHGFGVGDPTASATQLGGGVLTGSIPACCVYTTQGKTWGEVPTIPVEDTLTINAQNISDITVNTARARVDCNVSLDITSDGPLTVHIPECARTDSFVPAPPPSGLPNTAGAGDLRLLAAATCLLGLLGLSVARRRLRGGRRAG